MANASTTQSSSASETTGTPIPLSYGYVWATGKRSKYYQLQDTGDSVNEYTRLGLWKLGHGEWDGCVELWINDLLVWNGVNTPAQKVIRSYGFDWLQALDGNPEGFVFNFHSGCDSTVGSELSPTSTGPDQGLDILSTLYPPAVQCITESRIAYYTLMRKQPILNQSSNNGNDASMWTDIAPVGLWRALKCRMFDDEGNQTGYAFTTNPAWHFVDVLLRRKLMPDYRLDLTYGPDKVTQAVQNRFDWGSIFTAAQYFDEILPNSRRRFEGHYSFNQQTSLQAVLEQILICCRSFSSEYAGKVSLKCDMPRSSVFTFSRAHILPGSWDASDQSLHKTANRFIGKHRDILVPECSQIASITCTYGGNPVVTTVEPHPCEGGDRIAIGGTNTTYDGQWAVYSVPAIINPGSTTEVDPSTLTLVSKGTNFPASVGAGGGLGLLYSRFKERTPEFWHKNNMLARGVIGLGIPLQRNKVKQELDFATSTYDQVSRLTCYERDRQLGIDQSPYITPPCVKFRTSMFARDAAGNLACAIECGDHVTLDDSTNFQYAGEYEVLEPRTVYPPSAKAAGSGGEISLKPDENSGEIEFSLGPYNEAVMYDTSDPTQAGWPSVPGSDPGNSSSFTAIPLAAGNFSFFTGSGAGGSIFQLPSTGYPVGNTLAWASPEGFGGSGWSGAMATIELCDVSSSFGLTLKYEDNDGSYWIGQANYACLAWLSADVTASSGGLTWVSFTLQGGEEIVFGRGIVAGDGSFTVSLPAGFTTDKMFAVAFPHDGVPTGGHDAHWVGAYVDSSQVVHLNFKDGEGNVWHGNASVLVFAWKNNMGTWTTQTLGGAKWAQCPLSAGLVFGVGCALGVADGSTLELPAAAGDGASLEAIVGTSGWDYPDNGNHAHGIYAAYLDDNNVVHIEFGDGQGNIWAGAADVFALYCAPASAVSAVVNISPSSATIPAATTLQFSATVLNNANQSVTWAVDGIPGGNVTVGTIDSTGFYSAPPATGNHTIEATSLAVPAATASAPITISSAVTSGGGWTVNGS